MKKFNQQNMATTELDFARQLMKNTNRKKVQPQINTFAATGIDERLGITNMAEKDEQYRVRFAVDCSFVGLKLFVKRGLSSERKCT